MLKIIPDPEIMRHVVAENASVRIAIIQFSELTYHDDLVAVIQANDMLPEIYSWQSPHGPLADFAGFILIDPITDPIIASELRSVLLEQSEQGKPILAMGAGAEWAATMGLVPGVENHKPAILLSDAIEKKEIITLRLCHQYQYNAFTRKFVGGAAFSLLPQTIREFRIPPALLSEMEENGLVLFRYEKGGIAAVSNKAGNVMAILPPFSSCELLFQSMREYLMKGYRQKVLPLYYYPRNN